MTEETPAETPAKKTAAKKAPAKKTAAKKAAEAPKAQNAPTPYLSSLPEGWTYTVFANGPDGEIVEVRPKGGDYVTSFNLAGSVRSNAATDLVQALRQVGEGVRALVKVAKQRAALAALEQEALATLGQEDAESDYQDTHVIQGGPSIAEVD